MNTAPLLEIHNLRHSYQDKTVLEAGHLGFFPETITGLAGPNGSGKSTLLNILGLIVTPSRGRVTFMGSPVLPFSEVARHRIALLTQEPYLLNRSVFDNVAYGLAVRRDTGDLKKRVGEALDAVGLAPDRFAPRHAHHLSGGEARRVALAARLVLKPDVLLLDEPTSHVDEQSSRMMRKAVLTARRTMKTTLVIASHDREWLDSIGDRVLTLLGGRVYDEGRLNILYGPWEQQSKNRYGGPVSEDAQPFPVPRPPHAEAMAIVPARSLRLVRDNELIPPGALACRCRVTGLNREQKGGGVHVTLRLGEILLVSEAGPDQVLVQPGERVFVWYLPSDVTFR